MSCLHLHIRIWLKHKEYSSLWLVQQEKGLVVRGGTETEISELS